MPSFSSNMRPLAINSGISILVIKTYSYTGYERKCKSTGCFRWINICYNSKKLVNVITDTSIRRNEFNQYNNRRVGICNEVWNPDNSCCCHLTRSVSGLHFIPSKKEITCSPRKLLTLQLLTSVIGTHWNRRHTIDYVEIVYFLISHPRIKMSAY